MKALKSHFYFFRSCCCCSVIKLCPTFCNPMDYSPPGSCVHGVFQARILEWVAISFCRGPSRTRDWTCVSCVGRWIPYHWATREALRPVSWTCNLHITKHTHFKSTVWRVWITLYACIQKLREKKYNTRGRGWEGDTKGRRYMYSHSWFMLLYSRKQHNIVKKLSSN